MSPCVVRSKRRRCASACSPMAIPKVAIMLQEYDNGSDRFWEVTEVTEVESEGSSTRAIKIEQRGNMLS